MAVTENIIQDGVVNAGTEIEIKAPEKCSWPNVMSVSRFDLISSQSKLYSAGREVRHAFNFSNF